MRHVLIILLAFGLITVLSPAHAEDSKAQDDVAIYTVTDVPTDVTADSAAHARDQAVAQAQRLALNQLLDRLGVAETVAKKLSDDDIATLVKNFEVQSEHTSSVRYLGTFTVQFKPNAVRTYLDSRNASYSEVRSNPVVVLPVFVNGKQTVLWEDKTLWRVVWENNATIGGLVPIIVPSGGLDDIASVSTAEAVQGKTSSIKAIINKYQAHGAEVVILTADLEKPGTGFKVDVTRYDGDGDVGDTAEFTLPAVKNKAAIEGALVQAVQQVRRQLEKQWKQEAQDAPSSQNADKQEAVSIEGSLPQDQEEPTAHLPVTVAINSLPEWAQIERKMETIPVIIRVDVITLQRGSTSIEIEFHGAISDLRAGLMQQGLSLKQDSTNKVWTLKAMQIGGNY